MEDVEIKKAINKNASVERDIEIALIAINGKTYKSAAQQYSISTTAVGTAIDNILARLGSSEMRQELEAEFPRTKYPEAYYSFWMNKVPPGCQSHTFALGCISIKRLRDRKDVLSKYMRALLEKVRKERNRLRNIKGNRVYLSDRGIPLLYVAEPCEVPVVTLENYTKWYDVYLVMPDGSVQVVEGVLALVDKFDDAWWVDHLYHPRLLYRLAQVLNATVDERAIEVAAGRWMIERLEDDHHKFDDPKFHEEN